MHNDMGWLLYLLLAIHYWPVTLAVIVGMLGIVWYVRRK